MQTFKPWHPVADVPEFLAGVLLLQPHSNRLSVVCDGEFANGQLLILHFDQFDAVALNEELNHQWPGESGRPELPMSEGSKWTFPFLALENSAWAADSNAVQLFSAQPTHYCILSAGDIIDVLASVPPRAGWASVEQVEAVLLAAEQLGGA